MIPTEWPPCSCCLQNSRTFESCRKSTVHQGHQRCSALMQILHPFVHSCLSCNRNLKCKPWRRKFLSQPFAKWTLLNAVQWMALILLLLNYFQQSIQILARTFSVRKNPRLSSLRGLLSMVLFGGLFLLPLASCQDNLQPTPSVKSLQLPNTMVYVGSSFIYNISEEVFDCEVESFVVSETADRFLSHWLAYNSNKRQLYGVPSEKDEGIYNILVVALSKDGDKVRGRVCGSRSFFIKVVPVSEESMMSIYPGADTSGSNIKTVQSLPCVPGSQVIHGTIILNVDVHNMNGHERMILLLKMADHLNVHSNKVSLFSGQASHPLIGQLDNPVVMAAGAGDGRFTKGSRSLLTWHMGCGAIKLEEVAFSQLETSAQDGSISSFLGVPVVGWHVMSGTQKNTAKRRVRRQIMGMTATPIPSSALPSRMSNMSTSVIISRTVVISSESTTSVSSVVLNRTEVSSFTISANTTRGSSQLPSRTDVQSSVFANVTSSARSFSPSSIMRTKSVSINSSTVTLSRNTTLPVQSSELMSSLNRTTQIMPSSIVSQSLNSTYITRTVKMTIVSSFLTLSSSVPARNSSSVSPNETTAVGSSSSALPSVNRTLRTSSTVGTSSLNLTLTSPTLRVSSSLETRTSSLATPSSKQLLIASSRLTSSASPHLTTHLPPSVAISTPPLNVSTSPAMSLTISRQTSLTVSLSSSFVSSHNTSVQEASSTVNQTSLSVIAVTSSSTSLLSRSLSSPSSLVGLETTAFMENASTPQLNSTAALGTVVPTLTSIISTSTDILLESSAPTLISLVPSPSSTIPPFSTVNLSISSTVAILNTSIPMITSIGGSANSTISFVSPSLPPSSLILPSSSVVSSASSLRINITSVIHVASSSIQVNVTSPSVVLSLTSSPIATSVNSTQTSAVISVGTSNTKRSTLVNATYVLDRSLLGTSAFSSTSTSGSQTFSSILAANGTVIATTSVGVNQTIVNITATPTESRSSSISTFQTTSAPSMVKISSSFFATTPSSPVSSFEVYLNSTAISRTQKFSTRDILLNSSALTQVVLSRTRSSSVLFITTGTLLNATSAATRLTNSSETFTAPRVTLSFARSSAEFSSSLVTSPSISQTSMTSVDTSRTLKTSMSSQNSTSVLIVSSDVSLEFVRTLVASSSSEQGNSSLRISGSTTVSTATVTGIPTVTMARSTNVSRATVIGIPTITMARSTSVSKPSSFTRQVSSSLIGSSLFTRSTLHTDFKTSSRTPTVALSALVPHTSSRATTSISTRIPSTVQLSSKSTPVNTTVTSIKETSGLTTVLSRNTARVMTHSSTLVKITSSIAPAVGSRLNTVRFSSSLVRSSVVTVSNMSTVTPLVTQESSTAAQFTPAGPVETSLIPVATEVSSLAATSLTRSSVVTGANSSKVTEISRLLTHRTSMSRSVTPVAPSSFALQSPSVESTQVGSSPKSTFVTSAVFIRETISVKSIATQSVTSGIQTSAITTSSRKSKVVVISVSPSVTPSVTQSVTSDAFKMVTSTMQASFSTVLTKVSSASRIPFTLASSKPQASSLRATSRRDESSVISSPISNMTDQIIVTTLLSKKSSVTFVAFTSSPESQTPYLSVTSRLPNTVTFLLTPGASSVVKSSTFSLRARVTTSLLFSVSFAAESMSSRTALSFESSTFTILASKLSSSRASTALYKTSLMTRVPSSRFSQVSTSVILQRSSRSTFSTSSPTSSVKFTSTISSVVSAKSSLVSRMSTPYMSTFASRTFSSNFTRNVTPTDSSVTISITPSSSVIIPTTAPANSPPRLYNNMGRVTAPAGKALYFTIPDDTFYDVEDRATTRGLSLSVSLANGTSIPTDYWLQFNYMSQTIYGLPLSEHVPSGVTGEGFLLRAQDSQGAEALDAFEVFVVPSEKPIVQELKVRTTNDFIAFSRNVSERLLLLKKIAEYYGDSDSSLIRVLNFTSGSVVMAWTNDSLRTDACDVEKLDYVENKLLLPDGQVREEFRDALPEFPVESASQQRFGVCNGTDEGTPLPLGAQSTEDENLWYKHVLVGVFVVFVVFVLAVLLIWYYRRRRPKPSNEKRTFKKRKPIVLGPEIELKPIPGKPLVLPDDDPSLPPSYISETSLNKPVYSDDEDEMDYGKRSPSVVYEPPPPFHATLADDPRNSPPPAYLMPPLY